MNAEDTKPYQILLQEERELSGLDVAIEVYAQLTRFVVRKQMTRQEASKLAVDMAVTFVDEVRSRPDPRAPVAMEKDSGVEVP